MTEQKKRYKAVIANQSYTIIGRESKEHMDMVTRLVNDQLLEIMQLSPQTDQEQASILLAINAVSDQLKKQEQLLVLQKKVDELRGQAIKATELENRIKGSKRSNPKHGKFSMRQVAVMWRSIIMWKHNRS